MKDETNPSIICVKFVSVFVSKEELFMKHNLCYSA